MQRDQQVAPLLATITSTLTRVLCTGALLPVVFSSPVDATGIGGKELQARIAECPIDFRLEVAPAVLGGIAAATASNLAGKAVDAVVTYLTQDRAATSQASLVLDGAEVSSLLDGEKCLYVFLMTPQLQDFLARTNSQGSDRRIPQASVSQIISGNLTRFFAVLSFDRPKDIADQSSESTSYFRPVVQTWHYSQFLGPGCPLFRSCKKRDVVVSMELTRPRDTASDERPIRSIPLAVAIAGTTAPEVGINMRKPASLSWFGFDTTSPAISNLRFSITETSRAGALANALGDALKDNKTEIQQAAGSLVYTSAKDKSELQKTALDEYNDYVSLYNKAKAASKANKEDPNNQNQYLLIKDQMKTQLRIAQAAWLKADIPAPFNELPPLP